MDTVVKPRYDSGGCNTYRDIIMDRLYKKQVEEYLTNYGKLVFISGARQVGKTDNIKTSNQA
ncbi:hypothetical protein [Candidatus Rickettsia kedanie]|uniref:AAA domain-containing protein n=1 Tax=Candidatus Rickettsia kedanie TaxID=3115352 RepID=A0ABP9TTY3_9RICK